MLKIQVLGKGMIPRGYGLAPRKEFFNADLTLIQTILITPGLKVNMLSPEDNKIIPVTNTNVKRLWDKYRSDRYVKPVVISEEKKDEVPIPSTDVVEPKKIEPEIVDKKADEKPAEAITHKAEPIKPIQNSTPEIKDTENKDKIEEKKNEVAPTTIKPILNDEKNKNNKK